MNGPAFSPKSVQVREKPPPLLGRIISSHTNFVALLMASGIPHSFSVSILSSLATLSLQSSIKGYYACMILPVCWLLFSVCSTPVLPQWHVKDLSHSAKSAGGRLQAYTLTHAYTLDPKKSEWADYAAVQAQCENLSRNELICNLSGNIRPRSSQLAEPLWTDPGIKSGISVHELTST